MTDHEINEAVAAECRVKFIQDDDGLWSAKGPGVSAFSSGISREHVGRVALRYTVCLNAMHEVETFILCDGDRSCLARYSEILSDIVGEEGIIHATAMQKVEAFLRMRGKWVEGGAR